MLNNKLCSLLLVPLLGAAIREANATGATPRLLRIDVIDKTSGPKLAMEDLES
jgi:hypothetical protein